MFRSIHPKQWAIKQAFDLSYIVLAKYMAQNSYYKLQTKKRKKGFSDQVF